MIGATFTICGELTEARRFHGQAEDHGFVAAEVQVFYQGPRSGGSSTCIEILIPEALLSLSLETPVPIAPPHRLARDWVRARGYLGHFRERPALIVEEFEYLGSSPGKPPRPWPTLAQLSERNAWMIGDGPRPAWMA